MCLAIQSCSTFCNPTDCSLPGSSVHGDSPCKNTGVGCHALLQGNFPTQGSNPGLSHCGRILYHLSHQGGILDWVAYPFSRGTSQPRNQTRVSCIAGRFFTSWATKEFLWNDTGPISKAFKVQVIQSKTPGDAFISVSCIKPKHQATLPWNLHSESHWVSDHPLPIYTRM